MDTILKTIGLDQITPDPQNPRQEFDPAMMEELKSSIKTHGIMSPLVVEKTKDSDKYFLVDGERRYRASKLLKISEVPVVVIDALDPTERLIKRVHIQEQNKNWTIFEKALAVKTLKDSSKCSVQDLAQTLGYSPNTIKNYILADSLSKRTATYIRNKKLPFDWVVEISYCNKYVTEPALNEPLQEALLDKIERGVIKEARKLRYYRESIRVAGDKIVSNIIKKKNYTFDDAITDAGIKTSPTFRSLYTNIALSAKRMEDMLVLGKKEKITVPSVLHFKCRKLIPILEEFMKMEVRD